LRSIGWGAEFADFDSDGWLDLAVANGSTFEAGQPPRLQPMRSFLFWNQQGKFFHDLAQHSETLSKAHVSRGLAVSDFDGDGDLDFTVVDLDGGVRLLRNDMPQNHWAQFRLRGRTLRFADGAALVAQAGGVSFRRAVGGASYLSRSTRTVHFGLGAAARIDRLEVCWPDGHSGVYTNLDAGALWELTEDDPVARRVSGKQALMEFWQKQRAAMAAMKVEGDLPKAVRLFREALALDPVHEDSLYYLANCLEAEGDNAGAREQFERLVGVNPHNQRGHMGLGLLLARTGQNTAARQSLERAVAINPEETGALTALGELELLMGHRQQARQRFALASRTNPRAAGARFLEAYIAWRSGLNEQARQLLQAARAARGPDWKPKGTAAEGDVRRRMHSDPTLLSRFTEEWDGTVDPQRAFQPLAAHLVTAGRR
jgi:Tfp pilus assembly protein PilF